MENVIQHPEKGALSREQVAQAMLTPYDDVVAKKKWGELHYVVDIKAGVAKQIKRHFQESLVAESFK
jgi:hypothetical protein